LISTYRRINSSTTSSKVPSDLKYAQSHEWVRVSGDVATVGITDHAQHELTDIVFVELPAVGRKVKAGEACAVVESVKTARYGAGWFYQIKLSQPTELSGLLGPTEYSSQIGP